MAYMLQIFYSTFLVMGSKRRLLKFQDDHDKILRSQ